MNQNSTNIQNIFRVKDSFIFTIFGASGDLAKLKIFPSLFSLAEQKRLPKKYAIIGYARSEKSQEKFREGFAHSVKKSYKNSWGEYQEKILIDLLEKVHYFEGKYDDSESFESYFKFQQSLSIAYDQEVFYFSTPPSVFEPIIENLAKIPEKKRRKIILEKPFGVDTKSAKELIRSINDNFEESQVFLLDHYLGKKAVRSILPLRYNNHILNVLLRSHEISNIQISALEPFGVEERLGYFDKMGTLKDMIQSHLLQILGFVLMDIPVEKSAKNIHREKNNILEALHFNEEKNPAVFGQYEGYCEDNKDLCSPKTNTFFATKLTLDREHWQNIPLFIRSGKFLEEKATYIVIEFKKSPHQEGCCPGNKIILELFPDESIHIRLLNENGDATPAKEFETSHSISCHGDFCLTEHALLFLDVLQGKKEHFLSTEEILSCWQITDTILAKNNAKIPEKYARKSKGPSGQNDLMKGTDFEWHEL